MKNYLSMKRMAVNVCLVLFGIIGVIMPTIAAPQAAIAPTQIQLNNLSFDQLQQAAQAGDPDAQYALGYMYYYGKNVSQDSAQALNWIKRAAVQGQSEAIKALALLDPTSAASSTTTVASAQQSAATPVSTDVTAASAEAIGATVSATTDDNTATADKNDKSATKSKNSGQYTIQIRASASKQDLMNYAKAHHLQDKAVYAQTKHKGKNWYTLQYGLYKTKSEAQAAMAKLPAAVKAGGPWVKSLGKAKGK